MTTETRQCPHCGSKRLESKGTRKNKFGELAYRQYKCLICGKKHSRFIETKYGICAGTLVEQPE